MEISKVLETPTGTVEFKGELTQEEADYVIKIGLSVLLQQGMLPFAIHNASDFDDADLEGDNEETDD